MRDLFNARPLYISAEKFNHCHYIPDIHTLTLGQDTLGRMSIADAAGVVHPYSLKRVLAHELEHTGQMALHLSNESGTTLAAFWKDKSREYMETVMTPQQLQLNVERNQKARGTTFFYEAKKHIENAYDDFIKPMQDWSIEQVKNEKSFQYYFNKVERPAIRAENKIAKILGEPLRSESYIDMQRSKQQMVAEMLYTAGATKKVIVDTPMRGHAPEFVKNILSNPKRAKITPAELHPEIRKIEAQALGKSL